ncbi:MAG: hypothetical protein PHQ66_02665 [Candidatus Nanoarchaeia archaeon]|nr:hypothetical protein [Candidatus Nanoarchaeia archaeon]
MFLPKIKMETNDISAKDLKLMTDYFSLKAVMPYLSDEKAVKDYLETQKLDIPQEQFKEYFSSLKKEVSYLIEYNKEARDFYLRLENPKSVDEKIEDLFSYKNKNNLEEKFTGVLKDTHNAVMKTNFNLYSMADISVSKIKDNYWDVAKIELYSYMGRFNTIFTLKKSIFEPKVILKTYLGENINERVNKGSIKDLFDMYWKSLVSEGQGMAGRQIKRIIDLEGEVELHLSRRKNNIIDIFEGNNGKEKQE